MLGQMPLQGTISRVPPDMTRAIPVISRRESQIIDRERRTRLPLPPVTMSRPVEILFTDRGTPQTIGPAPAPHQRPCMRRHRHRMEVAASPTQALLLHTAAEPPPAANNHRPAILTRQIATAISLPPATNVVVQRPLNQRERVLGLLVLAHDTPQCAIALPQPIGRHLVAQSHAA
jgi:hypothetical protein